jgi:hypothetical protein
MMISQEFKSIGYYLMNIKIFMLFFYFQPATLKDLYVWKQDITTNIKNNSCER